MARFRPGWEAKAGIDDDSLPAIYPRFGVAEHLAGDLAIRIWRDVGTLFMEIRDRGVPFDPVKKPNPDVMARLRRGTRGGLGVFFFRTLMDGLSYRRDGGENILTVSKKI